MNQNPYKLIWYQKGMSLDAISKNNMKFCNWSEWEREIKKTATIYLLLNCHDGKYSFKDPEQE